MQLPDCSQVRSKATYGGKVLSVLLDVLTSPLVVCGGSFAADYLEIIKTLKDSLILDYDDENETIRLKKGAKAVSTLNGPAKSLIIERETLRPGGVEG